jgi:hypothetical protein
VGLDGAALPAFTAGTGAMTNGMLPGVPGGGNQIDAADPRAGGSGLSSLLSNPALLAAGLGAAAGIAGNDDMNISRTSQETQNTSSATTGNLTANTNQNSSTNLAPWLQRYAEDYVGRSRDLANAPTTNKYLDQAGGLLSESANDPLVGSARGQQQRVIDGGLLNSNPYIDKVASSIGDRMGESYATGTRAGILSGAQLSGNDPRYSSAAQQTVGNTDRAFADSLGSTMASLYGNNYQNERAAQDAASRNSLAFGSYGQQAANNLSTFGQQDWMRPFTANSQYGNSINPSFGSQNNMSGNNTQNTWAGTQGSLTANGTQTQNIQAPNNWMAGVGGAAAGAGLWRSIFGGK